MASISKTLTATGLMILVARGLVDLDAPVNDYLGEIKLQARAGEVGEVGLMLEIGESGTIYATLAEQPRVPLQNVCYQDILSQFNNAGGGPFLRGWMRCDLETADVKRGRPSKLWLELKLRQNVLNGSLVAFSQRELYTGPLSHWVELRKE